MENKIIAFECINPYNACPDIGVIAKRSSVDYNMFWCKVNLPYPQNIIMKYTNYFKSDKKHWKQIKI